MEVGIDNRYNSYYTQTSNDAISNTDKTAVSSTSKTDTAEEYFKNLCSKYPGENIYMSDSYLIKKNEVAFNVSPNYVKKAISDPKVSEKLSYLLDQIPSAKQYWSTHKYTLDGSEIKSVSFVIDENGGVSCKLDVENKKSKDTKKTSDEEKLLEKKKKELKKKAEDLKEAREKHLKGTKGYKVCNYYNNVAKNSSQSLTATDDDSAIFSLDELVGMIQ